MKNIFIILFSIICLTNLESCKKKEDNKNLPGKNTNEYVGTANVVISYYDYNVNTGQDFFIEEKQYIYNTTIYIKPPLATSGFTETNPFNLQIFPERINGIDEEGHIDFSSSLIFTVSTGYVLLQYWNYTLVGEVISGTLQDNHIAEAAATNMLWAWDDVAGIKMTMPFSMANGATISGTITENNISLLISGQSISTYRKFTCQINAAIK